jgi:hypothetical protein
MSNQQPNPLIKETEIAFDMDYDSIGNFLNGRLLLLQDKSNKEIYYVINSKSTLKQGTTVTIIKDAEYYNSKNESFAVCDRYDVAVTKVVRKKKEQKIDYYNPEFIPKLHDMVTKLYKADPKFFLNGFKKVKSDTLLHSKMIKRFPDYNERKLVYSAVDFASSMIKKGEPNVIAIEKASEYYNVDPTIVSSTVSTRIIGFRMNYS